MEKRIILKELARRNALQDVQHWTTWKIDLSVVILVVKTITVILITVVTV